MQYFDYKCFQFRFDAGIAFVSINHPPINLLDEVLSAEFDKLGRDLEADEKVRVVVLQSAKETQGCRQWLQLRRRLR